MVVDLLRNDMGRIAATGSVAVPCLWQVERHPTLWQLTSTVTATARPEVGLTDLFRALFPCASVTGAPKVSSMAIIADLEQAPRGVYCGAVGLIRPDPSHHPKPNGVSARFAVAIRTAVVDKGRQLVEYGSGVASPGTPRHTPSGKRCWSRPRLWWADNKPSASAVG